MRFFSGLLTLFRSRTGMSSRLCRTSTKTIACMGLLSFFLGLAGCDPQRISELEEGVSTEADVRARFGEPEKIWETSDMASIPLPRATLAVVAAPGARTFEYNRQPAGHVNYMITIGPDGKMSSLRQVLTPQNFELVLPGMRVEQVRKLLGKPSKITPFALKQETHYDWRYLNPPSTVRIFTAVMDTDMRVVSTGSVDEESVNPSGGQR